MSLQGHSRSVRTSKFYNAFQNFFEVNSNDSWEWVEKKWNHVIKEWKRVVKKWKCVVKKLKSVVKKWKCVIKSWSAYEIMKVFWKCLTYLNSVVSVLGHRSFSITHADLTTGIQENPRMNPFQSTLNNELQSWTKYLTHYPNLYHGPVTCCGSASHYFTIWRTD